MAYDLCVDPCGAEDIDVAAEALQAAKHKRDTYRHRDFGFPY